MLDRCIAASLAALMISCGTEPPATNAVTTQAATRTRVITLAAYTIPREAYAEIIPAFRRTYRERTADDVTVNESYEASGAQARAVVGGFEADVVALSLEQDVRKVADAGLITHDFRRIGPHGGVVTNSIVVLAVRQGNPRLPSRPRIR